MAKQKKRNVGILFLIFLLLVVLVLVSQMMNPHRRKQDTKDFQTYNEENVDYAIDVSRSFDIILNQTNRNFRAGYPLDASFLAWFTSEYGTDAITDIAYRIYEGNHSPEVWYEKTGNSIHVLWDLYCKKMKYNTYRLSNTMWKESANSEVTVLDFVGDINFDENWYTMMALNERGGAIDECIAPEIQQELQSADITLVNNEFTYSDRGNPLIGKAYTFRANTQRVELLQNFGADIVSLANNHVYDYGEEALLDTMDTLANAGISYVGAGKDIKEASEIVYFNMNGRKIAYVSATQIEKYSNYTKEATDTSAGVLKTEDPARFLGVITEANRNSDYVIAYVHWGVEGVLNADAEQRRLAQRYIDAGADVIIGNHAHRLQGVEYIDGVPVFYGLGNFWFSTGTLYTTILQVRIEKSGELITAMLPCKQQNMTTTLLTEESDKAAFYQYIADISEDVAILQDGTFISLANGIYSQEELDEFPYRSGLNYATRTGAYDLEGFRVDIVGNR